MIVELLTEHNLEFLSLKGGCTGSSESTLVKIPHLLEIKAQLLLIPPYFFFYLLRKAPYLSIAKYTLFSSYRGFLKTAYLETADQRERQSDNE